MNIKVYHLTEGKPVLAAEISYTETMTTEDALERAYHDTQNIGGSWSMGPYFDQPEEVYSQNPDLFERNADYHPEVVVKQPLHKRGDRTFGLRSSMVGDYFVINDETCHRVDSCGFFNSKMRPYGLKRTADMGWKLSIALPEDERKNTVC